MMIPPSPNPAPLAELYFQDQAGRQLRYPPGYLPSNLAEQVKAGTFNPAHAEITPEAFVGWWCDAVNWANYWPHAHPEGQNCWVSITDAAMKWLGQAATQAILHAAIQHKGLSRARQKDILINVEGFWLAAVHVATVVHGMQMPLPDAHLAWRAHWNTAVEVMMKTRPAARDMLIVHEQPKLF